MASASRRRRPPARPLDLDSLLGDEERMIRDTVRRWVGERVLPEIGEWFDEGILPRELVAEVGELGLFGMHLEGYGCAGASATAYGVACRELEAGDSGCARSCPCRARWRCSRSGSTAARSRRTSGCRGWRRARPRLLRADRARLRLRPGQHAHPRPARRRRLGPQRDEDVDHERRDRRRGGRVGADRRRRARLRGPDRHAGLHDARHPPQAVPPGVDHQRADPGGRAAPRHARRCPASRDARARCPA